MLQQGLQSGFCLK